jgi:AcrR family transcriptional regulator
MTPLEQELHTRNGAVPAALAPTRPRRSGREHVSEAQRVRILAAIVRVSSEHGPEGATVARIVGLAGVSRRTFYELFEDRSDCLLAAIEEAVALAGERVVAACETHERWADRVRAGLFALLQFFDQEPQLARLCVVQSAAAGPATLARRRELLDQLARMIDQGRSVARRQPPPLTAEGMVGGALGVIHSRLLEPDPGALIELLNPLMGFLVLPYLGGGAARIELARARPAPPAAGSRKSTPNRLEGLPMRLTYRTMRALGAIAAQPGLSNAEVSAVAGVTDQGQISKLLARLARLGLIENTGGGQPAGTTNAWQLTPQGEHVEWAIRHETLSARR